MIISLSPNWSELELNELIGFVIGGDWGKSPDIESEGYKKAFCIRGAEIKNWKRDKGITASIRTIKENSLEKRKLEVGDILVEISGGGPEQPVGRTVLIDSEVFLGLKKHSVICTNFLRLMRPKKNINAKWLNIFLNFFYHSGEIVKYQAGSNNLRNLKFKDFSSILIPLPPLPEQRAIVAKLEALFSELDAGIASLQRARVQLGVYRQAVLKKAFEGELTRAWREQQTDLPTAEELLVQIQAERASYYQQQLAEWKAAVQVWEVGGEIGDKPRKPRKLIDGISLTSQASGKLPNIPDLWKWCHLGSVANRIQIGPFGSQLHKHDYVEKGIPVINPKHIKEQKIEPAIFIDEEKASSLPQYALKPNDILLGRRGEMGRSAFISKNQNGWMCGTGSLFIRFSSFFEAKLYSLILAERRVVAYLEEKGSGTTMTNLNSEILNNLPIQIISLPEQHQIVQEIESRLSVCDQLEKDIASNLEKAESLRQSLLKKAFAGELLTAAELATCRAAADWEPAAALLARIKQEKTQKQ